MCYGQKIIHFLSGLREGKHISQPSDERYRNLFDEIPVGVYRSTPGGMFVDVNPALVEMLGYESQEALLATHVIDLYLNPEDREYWQHQILSRQGRYDFETPMRKTRWNNYLGERQQPGDLRQARADSVL